MYMYTLEMKILTVKGAHIHHKASTKPQMPRPSPHLWRFRLDRLCRQQGKFSLCSHHCHLLLHLCLLPPLALPVVSPSLPRISHNGGLATRAPTLR